MSSRIKKTFSQRLALFKKEVNKDTAGQHPKLVLLMVANSHDPNIAKGCAADVKVIRKTFQHLCAETDYEFFELLITGEDYTRQNIVDAVTTFEPKDNDVYIFYYTGHGFRYDDDATRKFPQIDLRSHNDNVTIDFINSHTENLLVIVQLMRLMGGRINIVIGDCCNTGIEFNRTFPSQREMHIAEDLKPPISKKMVKRLLGEDSLLLLISSASRGEYAISDPELGSIFTHHFSKALLHQLAIEDDDDMLLPWDKIMTAAAKETFAASQTYDIGGGKPGHQQAQFEILVERI